MDLPPHAGAAPAPTDTAHGWLALTVSLEAVYRRLAALPYDFPGHLFLVGPGGQVLFDPGGIWQAGGLPAPLLARLGAPGVRVDPDDRVMLAGEPWLVQVAPVLATSVQPGIFALVALPEHALAAPLRALRLNTLALTGRGVLLLGVLLLGWLRWLVLRPLALLQGESAAQQEFLAYHSPSITQLLPVAGKWLLWLTLVPHPSPTPATKGAVKAIQQPAQRRRPGRCCGSVGSRSIVLRPCRRDHRRGVSNHTAAAYGAIRNSRAFSPIVKA
jgi:hypothetical protein